MNTTGLWNIIPRVTHNGWFYFVEAKHIDFSLRVASQLYLYPRYSNLATLLEFTQKNNKYAGLFKPCYICTHVHAYSRTNCPCTPLQCIAKKKEGVYIHIHRHQS
jgi:hypothetical protein